MARHIHIHLTGLTQDAGWEEGKHPRKDDGKFGRGSSGGKIDAGHAAKRIAQLKNAKGDLDTRAVFGNAIRPNPARSVKQMKPVDVDVPAGALIPTQPTVEAGGVSKYVRNQSDELPEVVKTPQGRYILLDGHHRAAAAILGKLASVRVRVVGTVDS